MYKIEEVKEYHVVDTETHAVVAKFKSYEHDRAEKIVVVCNEVYLIEEGKRAKLAKSTTV